jgi:catechol 2,3-dioxygenase-like lactoylglutathione lyase family enzyme
MGNIKSDHNGGKKMTVKYDHVHLVVTDIPGTVAWFKEMFGAKEKFLGLDVDSFDGTDQYFLDMGGTGLFIRGRTDDETLTPDPGNRYGIHHFSLRIPDVGEKIDELRGKGVKVLLEPEVIDQNTVYAFVQGPDNITIELIHRKHLS